MKLQGRNLSLNLRGSDVIILHRELRQIGLVMMTNSVASCLVSHKHSDEATLKFASLDRLTPNFDSFQTGLLSIFSSMQMNKIYLRTEHRSRSG